MAHQQPSSNQSRLPDRHPFPFLRDLAHPHWNGINGIATIIGVFVGIVVGIIVAQGQGTKLPSSNGQLEISSSGYSMTPMRQASSATPTATDTPTTRPSLPNIVGSYSGTHTFSGLGEPHQPMSLTITQQHGQSFSGTCMLQRKYQVDNGSSMMLVIFISLSPPYAMKVARQ